MTCIAPNCTKTGKAGTNGNYCIQHAKQRERASEAFLRSYFNPNGTWRRY